MRNMRMISLPACAGNDIHVDGRVPSKIVTTSNVLCIENVIKSRGILELYIGLLAYWYVEILLKVLELKWFTLQYTKYDI